MCSAEFTVSVIIPTHNRAHLLKNAVTSVLQQTYPIKEILVVDDGSDGNASEAVVESFKCDQIRYFRHARPMGANVARNTGIRNAEGDVLAFLDDDDVWLPQKIEKQIAVLSEDSQVGAVYCGIGTHDPISNTTYYDACSFSSGWLHEQILVRDITGPTSTYMIRRECFTKAGVFDEALPARQDWDMWIRIAQCYKIGVVPEMLSVANEHPGEHIGKNIARAIKANRMVFAKHRDQRRHLAITMRLKAHAVLHTTEATAYIFAHRWGRGILSYLCALAFWPLLSDAYFGLMKALIPMKLRRLLSRQFRRIAKH